LRSGLGRHRLFHGGQRQEHRLRVAKERTLADSREWLETITAVKGNRLGFGIGHDANATESVTLIQGERQDVAEQSAPDAEPLGIPIHAESREPQDRKRVGGHPSPQAFRRNAAPLQTSHGDGCEPEEPSIRGRYVGDGEVKLELVLAGVVMEESIEIRLPAGEGASVVLGSERPDFNDCRHASVS
jgi:hypothetical protein